MRLTFHRALLALACLSLSGLLTTPARAQTYTFTWVGLGIDNNWTDSDNWRNGGSPFPSPGAVPFAPDTALFTTRLQPIGFVQSYNVRLDRVAYLTSMIFSAVPDPLIPDARYTITVPSSYQLFVNNGITASTADAADFAMNGALGFGGSVTVNNLTGSGIIFTSLASGTLTQVGAAGNYTGMISNGGDLDDGSPPSYTTSLTVGDGTQTASLTLAPPNPSLNPNKYSGTTLVKANATLVGGVANALSARSAHVIDGTLSLPGGSSTVAGLSGTGTVDLAGNGLTINGGGTFNGAVTGTVGALVKSGTDTFTLTGSSNYTGGTTISAGSFLVEGTLSGTGTINLTGGAIGGDGTIGGSLHFGLGAGLAFDPTKTLTINGVTVTFDGFSIANVLGLDSTVALGTYALLDGPTAFDFTNVTNFGPANGYALGNGKYAYFQSGSLDLVVVPEPSTVALLLLSGVGLFMAHRRAIRALSDLPASRLWSAPAIPFRNPF